MGGLLRPLRDRAMFLILCSFLAAAVAPLVIFTTSASQINADNVQHQAIDGLTSATAAVSKNVATDLSSLQDRMSQFVLDLELSDPTQQVAGWLSSIGHLDTSGIHSVLLFDRTPTLVASWYAPGADRTRTNTQSIVNADQFRPVIYTYATAYGYGDAMTVGGDQVLPIFAQVQMADTTATNGLRDGMLVIFLKTSVIQGMLDRYSIPQHIGVVLADAAGRPVASTGDDASTTTAAAAADFGATTLADAVVTNVNDDRLAAATRQKTSLFGADVLTQGPWALYLTIATTVTKQPAVQFRHAVTLMGGAFGVVLLLGLVYVAWLVVLKQRVQQEMIRLARTDPLTGIANRRVWQAMLELECGRSLRNGSPISVILLDIDHFKKYNDSFGHPAGDRLLITATAAWKAEIRETDVLARWGGEEFIVLLPDSTAEGARGVADRLREVMPHGQTCSAGVTTWNGEEPMKDLISRADTALYRAKETRNSTVVDPGQSGLAAPVWDPRWGRRMGAN